MKNAYQVVDTTTKTAVKTGFEKRKTAKKDRDKRNAAKGSFEGKFIVSRGDGHPLGASFGPVVQDSIWIK